MTKFLKSKESQSFVQIARTVKERVSIYGIYDAVNKQQQTQIKLNCLKKQLQKERAQRQYEFEAERDKRMALEQKLLHLDCEYKLRIGVLEAQE